VDESRYGWKNLRFLKSEDPGDCSAEDFDDSLWAIQPLPLANQNEADNTGIVPFTGTIVPDDTGALHGIWIRRVINATPGVAATVYWRSDDDNKVYWNGELIASDTTYSNDLVPIEVSADIVKERNILASRVVNNFTVNTITSLKFVQSVADSAPPNLDQIVSRICIRGGLSEEDIDVSGIEGVPVLGYPIARQANAADCLLPLTQAYFGFGSEYDARLHFHFYGGDADVIIDRADLIEGNDANNGAITSNMRNQATEFPRRIVCTYMDPAQNYTPVNVPAEMRPVDVIAIGDKSLEIPVVMSADDATKAAHKALKVAYATLEGTLEYSTPFAASDVYLSLVAGAPL